MLQHMHPPANILKLSIVCALYECWASVFHLYGNHLLCFRWPPTFHWNHISLSQLSLLHLKQLSMSHRKQKVPAIHMMFTGCMFVDAYTRIVSQFYWFQRIHTSAVHILIYHNITNTNVFLPTPLSNDPNSDLPLPIFYCSKLIC